MSKVTQLAPRRARISFQITDFRVWDRAMVLRHHVDQNPEGLAKNSVLDPSLHFLISLLGTGPGNLHF